MEIILVVAGTFLLCWLLDRGFQKLFRNAPQHISGKAVRLNKFYALAGLMLIVLGVASLLAGNHLLLTGGGIVLIVVGACLDIYFLGFGVFYDSESFLVTSPIKKRRAYRFDQIQSQQLYQSGSNIVIELYLSDGTSLQLQSSMTDVYAFLDAAFAGWCRQRGVTPESCAFHDPDNSCWFPPVEG